jgi:hypothetical protein
MAVLPVCVPEGVHKVYWLTIFRRRETGGERPPKRDSKFDPFLTTGAEDRISL